MNRIEIDHLTQDYGGGKGVFDLTFTVKEGEAFGFLGPNGAGKTTTIRHLMGFIHPQQGRCSIGGLDCVRDTAAIQQNLGYIPGEITFMEEMSGAAFLRFIADYRGLRDRTAMQRLLDRFELQPTGPLRKMSKGMKQKIGIVCAFMHDPDVLVLDEPTSGLDPLMQNRFVELVLEHKKRGKTILMSSHMFEEVERTCDRVGILRRGHLAAVDGIAALKAARRCRYVVELSDEKEAAAFAAEDGFAVESREDRRVVVSVGADMGAFTRALAAHEVTALDAESQSLEDVFMQYYGGDRRD